MKNFLHLNSIFTAFFVLTVNIAFSQNVHQIKADELYQRFAYSEAITEYELLLKKKPDHTEAKIRLAECYRLTGASEKAEFWYGQVAASADAKPIHKLYYGQALMNNNKYDKAREFFQNYLTVNPEDKRAATYLKSIENFGKYFEDTGRYKISKLPVNSTNGDFCPVLYNNGIIFASSRDSKIAGRKKHEWTGQPFLNLYYSKGSGTAFSEPEGFASNVQIKYNDGPVCFNKAGDEIYITRNNMSNGKVFKSDDKVVKLKIFHAKKINGEWQETKKFKYNNENYSCADAALSPDGKRLFFASDMPGGHGGMDLYVCEKDSTGWAKPVNLGEKINTEGNELFPYLHDDGTFLFSSNGRDGLGGLDVYWCRMKNNMIENEVANLGAPVNSSEDDFGIVFDNQTHNGYFSSNRESKNANDDIYNFKKQLKVRGIVLEKGTGKPVPEANVILKYKETTEGKAVSKEDGTFSIPAGLGKDYIVEATKEGWSVDTASFSTLNVFPIEDPYVVLEINQAPVAKQYQLIVKVIEKGTKIPIEGADIGIDKTEITLGYTDAKGYWKQPLKPNTNLHLVITKPGYQTKVIYMSNVGQAKEKDYEFVVELMKGDDIGPYARWYKIIYFDFDKANIRDPDATATMQEVLEFVKAHDDVRLLMNSYCDARGTVQYNMKLSKRRAEGATNWLVKNGMDRKIVEKMEWGGESMLMNRCADGSLCAEIDHQLNRRTEIRVIRVERGLSMKR